MSILFTLSSYWYIIVVIATVCAILFSQYIPGITRINVLIGAIAIQILTVYLYATRTVELEHQVKDLKDQVTEQVAAVDSSKQNVKVITKYLTKVQVVHDVYDANIKYIDKVSEKIDNKCTLSVEAIDAHNQAAATPPEEFKLQPIIETK